MTPDWQDINLLRRAWEAGIACAVSYSDNVGHLMRNTGGQADRHFQQFVESIRDVPAQPVQEPSDVE